jgi:hypothetical protein
LKNADFERALEVLESRYLRQHKINSAPGYPQPYAPTDKQTTVELLLNLLKPNNLSRQILVNPHSSAA